MSRSKKTPPLLHACQPSWRSSVRRLLLGAIASTRIVESSSRPHGRQLCTDWVSACHFLISSAVLTSRPRRGGSLTSVTQSGSDIADCGLAVAAILLGIERYLLAFDKVGHSGSLERARMHKHVFSTIVGLDKAKALLHVVKFHCSRNHRGSSFRCSAVLLEAKQSRGSRIVHRCLGGSERAPSKLAKAGGHNGPAKCRCC